MGVIRSNNPFSLSLCVEVRFRVKVGYLRIPWLREEEAGEKDRVRIRVYESFSCCILLGGGYYCMVFLSDFERGCLRGRERVGGKTSGDPPH